MGEESKDPYCKPPLEDYNNYMVIVIEGELDVWDTRVFEQASRFVECMNITGFCEPV